MKRILITGKDSYIGRSTKMWLERMPGKYQVDEIDVKNGTWKETDFKPYDCVFHVAGIVHQKQAPDELYMAINYKLAVDVLKKAIQDGVGQFIFMSSGAVYAQSDKRHGRIVLDENSSMQPCTVYGKSKMLAENEMYKIAEDSEIRLAILRPPTVYGYNAKGNYKALSALAQKTIFFPEVKNIRSMIYIENLCEFVRLVIDNDAAGSFLPQNREYVNISNMVKTIGEAHGKEVKLIPVCDGIIDFLGSHINVINKVFGTNYYEKHGRDYFDGKYQVVDFISSIYRSENIPQ